MHNVGIMAIHMLTAMLGKRPHLSAFATGECREWEKPHFSSR